jgi:hypothetical protein
VGDGQGRAGEGVAAPRGSPQGAVVELAP